MSDLTKKSNGKTDPLVSIIIPCHNYGQFLSEAITSVILQRYPHIEIIVVDDASTDKSVQIAKELFERFKNRCHYKLIQSPVNQGTCRTVNTGIRASHGDYFVILDADDKLCDDYIKKTVSTLQNNIASTYCYTDMQYFGTRLDVHRSRPFSAEALLDINFVHAGALTYRWVFDEVGGYNESLSNVGLEDWDFRLRCLEAGHQGIYLGEPLYCYRQHGQSRNTISFVHMIMATFRIWNLHPRLYSARVKIMLLYRKVIRRMK